MAYTKVVLHCFSPSPLLFSSPFYSPAMRAFYGVCGIDAVYQLQDSISNTGSLIMENPAASIFSRLPYGEMHQVDAPMAYSWSITWLCLLAFLCCGLKDGGPSAHGTLMNVFDKVPVVDKEAFVAPSASMTVTFRSDEALHLVCMSRHCGYLRMVILPNIFIPSGWRWVCWLCAMEC
ncbi:hypothetical protein SLEP1_g12073 [Rubroshorea leprosula]|nr:hypothetical protein SLEP1_g12073 [Rubroshorea leprosula]